MRATMQIASWVRTLPARCFFFALFCVILRVGDEKGEHKL